MVKEIPHCMGDYNFDEIADFAQQHFVDGIDTVSLLIHAKNQREKEEIMLVSLLDVADDRVRAIELSCRYADQCQITDCRDRLRCKLEANLGCNAGPH